MITSYPYNMYELETKLVSPRPDSSVFHTIYYADVTPWLLRHMMMWIDHSARKLKHNVQSETNTAHVCYV